MGQTAAAILAINNRKVADLTEATVTIKSGGQLIATADDIIKSRGKATAEVTFTRSRPVAGSTFSVVDATIRQTVGVVTMQIQGGELIEITGTFDQTALKTQIASGMTDENPTFSGAVRVIQ
jgi:hypothetical protein